jgi:hypothetical protein
MRCARATSQGATFNFENTRLWQQAVRWARADGRSGSLRSDG